MYNSLIGLYRMKGLYEKSKVMTKLRLFWLKILDELGNVQLLKSCLGMGHLPLTTKVRKLLFYFILFYF
jgi:hypothetical protein